MPRFFVILLALKLITFKANAQCTLVVPSTNGYTVTIKVTPVSVIANPNPSCPNGYNYNLVINYTVSVTGTPPSNFYTLQGYITCNTSDQLFYSLPLTGTGSTGSYTTTTNPYISSNGTNVYTTHPSCSAANPTNLSCGTTNVHIQAPGINDQTTNCPGNSSLPVGLADFSASKTNQGILLKWQTVTEKNNNFFEIERSLNGTDWEALGKVNGQGTTSRRYDYTFMDEQAPEGINYYRLRQTDFDGTFAFSPVAFAMSSATDFVSNIRPNPATDAFNFQINSGSSGRAQYTIFDETGSAVKTGEIDFYAGTTEISVPAETLQAGMYLFEISMGGVTQAHKKAFKL